MYIARSPMIIQLSENDMKEFEVFSNDSKRMIWYCKEGNEHS